MTTFRLLSRPLRLAIATPWLLIAAGVALGSTPAFRQVLIDAANQPTADVSLSSTHWTGTLAAARLPASVPLLAGDGSLFLEGNLTLGESTQLTPDGTLGVTSEIYSGGYGQFVTGVYVGTTAVQPSIDGDGNLYGGNFLAADTNGSLYAGGNLVADASGTLYAGGNRVTDQNGSLYAGGSQVADQYGNLYAQYATVFDSLSVNGSFLADDGAIRTDGYGDLSAGSINTPNLVVSQGITFSDGSYLTVSNNQLLWTDAAGTVFVLASGN